jgi:hypothetical protein
MDKFTHSFFNVVFAVVKLPLFVFILIGMISAARSSSRRLAPVRASRPGVPAQR